MSLCDVQLRTYNSRLTIDLSGTLFICLGDFSDQLPLPALRSGRLQPFLGHRRPQKILPLSSARVLACGSSIVSEPSPHPIRESAQSKLGRGETKTYLCTAGANQQVNNIPRNARCCRTVDNDRRPCCLLSVFPRLCPLGLKLKPLRPHSNAATTSSYILDHYPPPTLNESIASGPFSRPLVRA